MESIDSATPHYAYTRLLQFEMTKAEIYNTIDRELEKWVYLLNAEEGNYGIYELTWELEGYDFLDIADKYLVALDLLTELLLEEMVVLEEYLSPDFKIKIRTVDDPLQYSRILNTPANWYPSGNLIYAIKITAHGLKLLEELSDQNKITLNERIGIM